jgi:hypothetical protein
MARLELAPYFGAPTDDMARSADWPVSNACAWKRCAIACTRQPVGSSQTGLATSVSRSAVCAPIYRRFSIWLARPALCRVSSRPTGVVHSPYLKRRRRAARPQYLETKSLRRACDLPQSHTFERSGGKCRSAEQKSEMPVIFRAGVTSVQVMPFVVRHRLWAHRTRRKREPIRAERVWHPV